MVFAAAKTAEEMVVVDTVEDAAAEEEGTAVAMARWRTRGQTRRERRWRWCCFFLAHQAAFPPICFI